MKVLGIDPGLRELGWAVLRSNGRTHKVLAYGVISTDDEKEMEDRFYDIGKGIERIFAKFKPDICAVESVFVWKDPSAALKLGIILGICAEISRRKKAEFKILSPLFVKSKITKDRFADKDKIRRHVVRKSGLNGKLKKDTPHHITDAIAIALSFLLAERRS